MENMKKKARKVYFTRKELERLLTRFVSPTENLDDTDRRIVQKVKEQLNQRSSRKLEPLAIVDSKVPTSQVISQAERLLLQRIASLSYIQDKLTVENMHRLIKEHEDRFGISLKEIDHGSR